MNCQVAVSHLPTFPVPSSQFLVPSCRKTKNKNQQPTTLPIMLIPFTRWFWWNWRRDFGDPAMAGPERASRAWSERIKRPRAIRG